MANEFIRLEYPLKRVLTSIHRLRDESFAPYVERTLPPEEWDALTRSICVRLDRAESTAVRRTLLPYVGRFMTAALADDLSQLLAGNEHRLAEGQTVTHWIGQSEPEWVPVHVQHYQWAETRDRRPAAKYWLRVLAGTPVGMCLERTWPAKFVPLLARRLGYTRRRQGLIYSHPSELVNLCLAVYIEPQLCKPGKPGFEQTGCTHAILKRNRAIVQKRFRRQGAAEWPCPQGYRHRCHTCHVGFDTCPAATHALTEIVDEAVPGPVVANPGSR